MVVFDDKIVMEFLPRNSFAEREFCRPGLLNFLRLLIFLGLLGPLKNQEPQETQGAQNI